MKEYLQLFGVLFLISATYADYQCVCNYDVEKEVFDTTTASSDHSLGYLYEFDCKEQLEDITAATGWIPIAFEHKVGYIESNENTKIQTCPGDSPDTDKVEPLVSTAVVPDVSTVTTEMTEPTTQTPTTVAVTTTTTTEPITPVPSTSNKPIVSSTLPPETSTTSTPAPTTTSTTTTAVQITEEMTTTTTTTQKPTPSTMAPTTSTTTAATTTQKPSTSTIPPTTTTTKATTNVPSTTQTVKATTTAQGIMSGNTSLCPVALKSFTAHDGGMLTQYDKKCYEVVPHRQSWTYAERDCKGKGGNLVQIKSAEEQAFLVKYLNTHYNHNIWIGLHDINNEGHFEWDADPNSDPPVYSNWEPGVSTHHKYENCVYLRPQNNGYWYDGECSGGFFFTPHAYVCQYETDPTALLHGTVNPHGDGDTHLCPSSVQIHASRYHGILGHYKNSCYEVLPRFKVTWSHGEQSCRQRGGHLAHISSADEQNFIQDFMTNHLPDHAAWIGLNDKSYENHFVWTSGHPVTYTNWVNGHEGNFASHHKEDCALFIPYQKGQWDDLPCGQSNIFGDVGEIHPIICQFDATGPAIIG